MSFGAVQYRLTAAAGADAGVDNHETTIADAVGAVKHTSLFLKNLNFTREQKSTLEFHKQLLMVSAR